MSLINLGYNTITGALHVYRARCAWRDGSLYLFCKDKTVYRLETEEPKVVNRKRSLVTLNTGERLTFNRTCGCGMPVKFRMSRVSTLITRADNGTWAVRSPNMARA